MGEFSLKFRGVRGSYPIADIDFLQYGGNTACVEVNVGGHLIILDAGSGMINLGNDLMQKYITSGVNSDERTPINVTLLLSHIHQDHLQGFTFFKPLHLSSTQINVFGNISEKESLKDEFSNILFGRSFPLDLNDISGNVDFYNLADEQVIILRQNMKPIIIKSSDNFEYKYDDVVIENYKSYAHPQDGVTIYKISYKGKSLVYATDKESYLGGDKKLIDIARDCNLLIHDAQYTTEDYEDVYTSKQGYGHSTFDMAIDVKKQANAEKLVFFHYAPEYSDSKLDRIAQQYSDIMARENMVIDLI